MSGNRKACTTLRKPTIGDLHPGPIPPSLRRSWLSRPLPQPLAEWWLDLEGAGMALNTRLAYVRDMTDVAEYLGALDKTLAEATPEDLLGFTRQMTLLNFSTATRSRRITALRVFYDWHRQRTGQLVSVAQDLRPPRQFRAQASTD